MNYMKRRKTPREATLREYVGEVLKKATYEPGETLNVLVAEVPELSGCFTQGASFEEARENLIDAIEVWIMSALQCGEELPVVNGYRLAISAAQGRQQRAQVEPTVKA